MRSPEGRSWEADGRDVRYNARVCEHYHTEMERERGLPVCGMCLFICLRGRKGS